jgi:hypothetical protein
VFWAFQAAPLAYVAALVVLRSMERPAWLEEQPSLQYVAAAVMGLVSIAQLRVREPVARRTAAQSRARGDGLWESQAAAELARMSLNEAIAIYGLVVFLLTAKLWLALPFMLLGAVALYVSRPQKHRWRDAAKEERT